MNLPLCSLSRLARSIFLLPEDIPTGRASLLVGAAGGEIAVASVAPGIFSAAGNGQGVVAATAVRVAADNTQTPLPVFRCDVRTCTSVPLDLGGPGDQVILVMYGTGIRSLSSLQGVQCSISGAAADVLLAGSQTGFVGLDQVNVRVPPSLAGRGEVEVVLTVDGRKSNTVRVNVK